VEEESSRPIDFEEYIHRMYKSFDCVEKEEQRIDHGARNINKFSIYMSCINIRLSFLFQSFLDISLLSARRNEQMNRRVFTY